MAVKVIDALRKMCTEEGVKFDIEKDIISTQTVNYDGALPIEAVTELIDLTMDQAGWLKSLPRSIESGSKGKILVNDWGGPAAYPKAPGGSPENIRESKPIHPSSYEVPYECFEYRSDFILTRKMLREAARLAAANGNVADFNTVWRAGYAKALNNTIADLCMNGDTSLAGLTDWEKSRMGVDGILKLSDTGTILYDANGVPFDMDIFPLMLDMMPDKYANDGGLRWFCNRRMIDRWKKAVGGVVSTASFMGLSAEAITQRLIASPEGIDPIIVPQIASNMGPNAAPDEIADATGKVKIRCDTAFRGYSATHAGRKVRVIHKITGVEEIGSVADDTSHLEFTSSGMFGNPTVDLTEGNYIVYVYDESLIMLTNPSNLRVVFDGEWRTYPDFDKYAENFVSINHFNLGFVIANSGALVKADEMQLTPMTL